MFEQFYLLKTHPFRLSPDPAFLCMTEQHREVLSGLVYSVCTRPGLTVLVGDAGLGKTTILYTLVRLLEGRQHLTAMCTNPMLSREEFYEFILMAFGVQCSSGSKTRQLFALEQALKEKRAQGRPAVLIVDEAQRLSTELLEEIRLLLNLETPEEKLLEIVLSGQPELRQTLARPELRQLKQRVSCLCVLTPLTRDQAAEYIQHRLAQAGRTGPALFSAAAIDLLHSYSGGIPRVINTLAETCLRTGFAARASTIGASIVQEAARELELANPDSIGEETILRDPVLDLLDAELADSAVRHAVANHNGSVAGPVPLESYAARQQSLGFLAQWVRRRKAL